MPKTKLGEHVKELKIPKADKALKGAMGRSFSENDVGSKAAQARYLGITEGTYLKRLKDLNFSRHELQHMFKVLEFTDAEILACMRESL